MTDTNNTPDVANEPAPHVVHNAADYRFEIFIGDERVGLVDYERRIGADGGTVLNFVHTEVSPAHQGKNLAAILTREAFEAIRSGEFGANAKVWPVCSYTVMYMQRHPESHDLVAGNLDEAVAACRVPNVAKFNSEHGKKA